MTNTPAPYPEDPGYNAIPGFVKGNPLNNDYYVASFEEDTWYPAILKAHQKLAARFPGYNIAQIKEKFGGLRYYVSQGDCPDEKWDHSEVDLIIREAEAAIDDLENRRAERN